MLTVSSFLKLIFGILCLFGLGGFSAGIISDIINESRKKKLNDFDELRRISKKLAKKNPELERKMSDKMQQEQILDYLNEKRATNKRENETKFTSIEPITQGKLLGPQELVDVLTLIRKKKEKNR